MTIDEWCDKIESADTIEEGYRCLDGIICDEDVHICEFKLAIAKQEELYERLREK